MPELRRDPVLGRWVIMAADRVRRPLEELRATASPPSQARRFCPFCEGNEDATAPEIRAYRENGAGPNRAGWRVRAVPNKYPALQVEGDLDKRGDGIYDLMNGVGAHEVVIDTPRHVSSIGELPLRDVNDVLWMCRERLHDLKKDVRLVFGLTFKNVGTAAGATLEHSHTQLICTPTVPRTVAEEMARSADYYEFRGRCLFCDMVRQELAAYTRVVKDTHGFVAFAPFAARSPFEIWIVPKRHASHFEESDRREIEDLGECLRATILKLEKALDRPAYNYLIHSSPFDRIAVPSYHWHLEIIPRLVPIAGFEWGTDFYVNPVPPEKAAEYLRSMEVPGP